jgi:hypothetical protein
VIAGDGDGSESALANNFALTVLAHTVTDIVIPKVN